MMLVWILYGLIGISFFVIFGGLDAESPDVKWSLYQLHLNLINADMIDSILDVCFLFGWVIMIPLGFFYSLFKLWRHNKGK